MSQTAWTSPTRRRKTPPPVSGLLAAGLATGGVLRSREAEDLARGGTQDAP